MKSKIIQNHQNNHVHMSNTNVYQQSIKKSNTKSIIKLPLIEKDANNNNEEYNSNDVYDNNNNNNNNNGDHVVDEIVEKLTETEIINGDIKINNTINSDHDDNDNIVDNEHDDNDNISDDNNSGSNILECNKLNEELDSNKNRTNLIVNYLPQNMSQEEMRDLFGQLGEVESCKLVRDKMTGQSLSYGFVNYIDAQVATIAIKQFNGLRIQNKVIKVSLARPSSETIKGANLYICGLPKSMTQPELEVLFSQHGKIITCRILVDNSTGNSKGVAFIRFDQRSEAEMAIRKLNGIIPNGGTEPITVKLANTPFNISSNCHHSLNGPPNNPPNPTNGPPPPLGYNGGPPPHPPLGLANNPPGPPPNGFTPLHQILAAAAANGPPCSGPPPSCCHDFYPTQPLVVSLASSGPNTSNSPPNNACISSSLRHHNNLTCSTTPPISSEPCCPNNPQMSPTNHNNNKNSPSSVGSGGLPPPPSSNGLVTQSIPFSPASSLICAPPPPPPPPPHPSQIHQIAATFPLNFPGVLSSTCPQAPPPGPGDTQLPPPYLPPPPNHLMSGPPLDPSLDQSNNPTNHSSTSNSSSSSMWCLFVCNLSPDTKEAALWQTFGPFGAVHSVNVAKDPNGKCRGFGIVNMPNYHEAVLALSHLNGNYLDNRCLQIIFNPNFKMSPIGPYMIPSITQ